MKKALHWYDHLTINSYWLGINIASSILTPVLIPYLVALFVPDAEKNTYYGQLRVITLAVAMMIQPMAGYMSDRNTSRWGRRRPFIFWGALLNIVFLIVIGVSQNYQALTAYYVLLVGVTLLQVTSNLGHGALQGLIPDIVPENQRGKSSGVKTIMEMLPAIFVIFIGPLVDKGKIWETIAIICIGFFLTMLVTVIFVKEEPLEEKPGEKIREPMFRLIGLTIIFVAITQAVIWLVDTSGNWLSVRNVEVTTQIITIGLVGLAGMAAAIIFGVYFGARVGIGKGAGEQKSFIWWVINRLLFLAAAGSIQSFAQYYLGDVLHIENAATVTTFLLAGVALFLMISAVVGGTWADKFGRKRLIYWSGIIATGGTLILLFSQNIPMVILSGCIIGMGVGTFMATNWALGTDLAPKKEAGKYLGISNLAGAGAGIVGAGIGGPMADFFNRIQPGLGYLVIFALYGGLFLLSSLVLTQVKVTGSDK